MNEITTNHQGMTITEETIREVLADIVSAPNYQPAVRGHLRECVRSELDLLLSDDSFTALFDEALKKMTESFQLVPFGRDKLAYGAVEGYLTGTFRANAKGFGFFTPEDRYKNDPRYAALCEDDLFIGRDDTFGAMNGDLVTVRIKRGDSRRPARRDQRERSAEGQIVYIIERALTVVVGTLHKEEAHTKKGAPRFWVEPDSTRITAKVNIPVKDVGDAAPGDKVEAELTRYPTDTNPDAFGRVTYVFGDTMSREANYEVVLRENRIRTAFEENVLSDADAQAARPLRAEDRLDLRDKMIFTIDGADSKDLDDAVSLECLPEGGWQLGVHIADVSEYVQPKSSIDAEAFLRGTSVYFADKVVPMLPKALSNGICSLNCGEDRYALSALIDLDEKGEIRGCKLHESLVRSKIRGVYSELNDILDQGEASEFYEKYQVLFPDVYPEMHRLYKILDAKNRAKGALELETTEAKIVLDETGMPVDIIKREQGVSESMIEQFMLTANEAVAKWLYEKQMPCVYRVHEEPPEEKIQAFSTFAYNLGLDVRSLAKKELKPMDMQVIMNEAKEKGLDTILSTVMLRSLSKAKYSKIQGIHFGLATEFYCHFTSPIRRYPDLTVHRFVKTILHGEADEDMVKRMDSFAEKSSAQSTECEIRALTAERAIDDLYKVLYMQKHVGEEFDGVISSVTSFGFFVELDNTCEGLVPIATLDGFFTFDENNLVLSCGKTQFRIGQKVRVEVARADLITRKIDMALVPDPNAPKPVRPAADTQRTDRNRDRFSGRPERNRNAQNRPPRNRGGKVR